MTVSYLQRLIHVHVLCAPCTAVSLRQHAYPMLGFPACHSCCKYRSRVPLLCCKHIAELPARGIAWICTVAYMCRSTGVRTDSMRSVMPRDLGLTWLHSVTCQLLLPYTLLQATRSRRDDDSATTLHLLSPDDIGKPCTDQPRKPSIQ